MSKSKKPKPEAEQGAAAETTDAESAYRPRQVAIHCALAVLFVGGCVALLNYLRTYVDQTVARPAEPPRVEFANRPAWMTDLLARQLAESFRPAKPRSVFDHDALVQTTARLKANPWVAKVNQVRRAYGDRPGDTIEIDCEFRAPVALVRHGFDYWFVDADGVKLPERFREADLPKIIYTADGRTNVRVVEGVRSPPPPDAGRKWPGDDLAAGLELVRRLSGQPFAEEVVKVRVDNYAGRIDPREAQLVLVTRHDTEVRWGRPWNGTDGFIEVRPERKMDTLRRIVAVFGRVDAGQRWIDVRFDDITCPSPGAEPASAQVDGGR